LSKESEMSTNTAPSDERTVRPDEPQPAQLARAPRPVLRGPTARVAALLRICYGLIFLWAFADKVFGLHYSTPGGAGWIAGAGWVNWLFMLALLGIGLAFTLGVVVRIAAGAGALLYLLMWSVTLPPATNPVLDDHVLAAITLVLLALLGAERTWGLAGRWARVPVVQRFPVLR